MRRKFVTCSIVAIAFALSVVGMGAVKQQFFPTSDRPEVLVEVRLPEGTSIETTTAAVEKLEHWLDHQSEAKIVKSYVGQGAPRFFFAMAPELPDPAFAKIVVLTPDADARETLKHRLRQAVSDGLAPEARVRVTQLMFGPYTPFPVEFRVMGPDPAQLYVISDKALDVMRGVPDVRQVNRDWGNRTPVLRFIPDQDRLNLIGLSSAEVGRQLQFLLTHRRYAGPRGHPQCPHRGTQCRRRAAGPGASGGFLIDEPGRPLDTARPGRPFGSPT